MIVIKPITRSRHSIITEFPLKLISTEIALDKHMQVLYMHIIPYYYYLSGLMVGLFM